MSLRSVTQLVESLLACIGVGGCFSELTHGSVVQVHLNNVVHWKKCSLNFVQNYSSEQKFINPDVQWNETHWIALKVMQHYYLYI